MTAVEENQAVPSGPAPEPISFREHLRSLGTNSAVFFIGDAAGRGLALLMLPLYTRALSPADYGIIAVAATVTVILTLSFSLSLDAAVLRLSFEAKDEAGLRSLYGTILVFLLIFSTLAAIVLDRAGMAGMLDIFESVPFDPYLRLTLWSAYAAAFMAIPVAIYTMRQQAARAVSLTLGFSLVQVAMTVLFVVVLEQGAIGALRGTLVASIAVGIASVALTAWMSSLRLSRKILVQSLLLSLPLIPHSLSQWVLHLSDRVVIEPYVTETELGLYSLAYSAAGITLLFIFAFSKALGPVILRQLKDDRTASDVPRMGTYVLTVLVFVCLAVALLGSPALRVATPPDYHGAIDLVPWIAFGLLGVAVYTLVSQGAWYAMRTGWIALGTITAGALNVGFNLLLVPPFGVTAAALSTMLGFVSLAAIQGVIAHRFHPIAWEYWRWTKLMVAAGVAFAAGWMAGTSSAASDFAIKSAAITLLFPAVLVALRFASQPERALLRTQAAALRARLSRA